MLFITISIRSTEIHSRELHGTRITSGVIYKIWEMVHADYEDGMKIVKLGRNDTLRPRSDLQYGTSVQSDFDDDIDFVIAMANAIRIEDGDAMADPLAGSG